MMWPEEQLTGGQVLHVVLSPSLQSSLISVRSLRPSHGPPVWDLPTAVCGTPQLADSLINRSQPKSSDVCPTCQIRRISLLCSLLPCSHIQRAHVTGAEGFGVFFDASQIQ